MRATEGCKNCPRWQEVKQQMRIAGILAKAVETFEAKLKAENFEPSVAEYLKLVQIEQEYERELNPPEEIQVRWVGPPEKSES